MKAGQNADRTPASIFAKLHISGVLSAGGFLRVTRQDLCKNLKFPLSFLRTSEEQETAASFTVFCGKI